MKTTLPAPATACASSASLAAPPRPGTLGRPSTTSTPIDTAPAWAIAVTSRASTARSHGPTPKRCSLSASRATTTTAGLTGASAGTQASRTEESIPATCALVAHTAATVTIVVASPITTAISPRPRRRTRI